MKYIITNIILTYYPSLAKHISNQYCFNKYGKDYLEIIKHVDNRDNYYFNNQNSKIKAQVKETMKQLSEINERLKIEAMSQQ